MENVTLIQTPAIQEVACLGLNGSSRVAFRSLSYVCAFQKVKTKMIIIKFPVH